MLVGAVLPIGSLVIVALTIHISIGSVVATANVFTRTVTGTVTVRRVIRTITVTVIVRSERSEGKTTDDGAGNPPIIRTSFDLFGYGNRRETNHRG